MSTTYRRTYTNTPCSDCGVKPSYFKLDGVLMPEGQVGYFCNPCFEVRSRRSGTVRPQLPPGETSYILRYKKRHVVIEYRANSPYDHELTEKILFGSRKLGVKKTTWNFASPEHARCKFEWYEGLDDGLMDAFLVILRRQFRDISIRGEEER